MLRDSKSARDFLSAMGAEAISCMLWVPIDVIKERLQGKSNISAIKFEAVPLPKFV